MKRVLLIASAMITAFMGNAQQDAQFSQNRFINSAINPGATGIKGMHCFDLVARDQWFGFEGRPQTGLLNYNGTVAENFGLGGVLVYDVLGAETNINFKINGAYHINLGSNGAKLGIGVDLGMVQKSMFTNVAPTAVDATDPIVGSLASGQNDMGFDLGFGLFYYRPQKLYFGVSGQKLLPQQLSLGTANTKLRQHAYITAGYFHPVTENITLKPNMLMKTDLTSTQVDVNLTAEFNDKIWAGASYRVQDAIVANVGYNVPIKKPKAGQAPSVGDHLKVGLAYDFTTQGLREPGTFRNDAGENIDNNRSLGAVELYLGYCFILPPPPDFDIYVDPLFL